MFSNVLAVVVALICFLPSLSIGAIFSDGFESGGITEWVVGTGSYTRSVTSLSPAVGAYSFTQTGGSVGTMYNGISHTILSSKPTYISFYAKNSSTSASSGYFVAGDSDAENNGGIIFFYFKSSGTIEVNDGVSSWSGGTYSADTWYLIEFRSINWTSRTFDFYVNGALKKSAINFRNWVTPALTQIYLYNFDNAQASYDEIQIGGTPVATPPVNGACGTSNGGVFTSAPSTNICTTGTASSVTGSGPWNWSCAGSSGGTTSTCSAALQTRTITVGAISNGTVSCTSPVNNGASSTCTVTPASGYQLATFTDDAIDKKSSVTGGSYSITNVMANHSIAATFSLIPPVAVNGTCGSSNGGTLTTTPSANLCTTGNASSVTGSGPWNWSCAGSSGGTTSTCSAALQTRTITVGTSSNGTVSCTSPVNNGASSTCTITPASGYQLATFTDDAIDKKSSVTGGSYSITNVMANHSIAATFSLIPPVAVNGTCGSSNGGTLTAVPSANLCTTGNASSVTGSGPWNWSCAGSSGGTTSTCAALIQTWAVTVGTASNGTVSCTSPVNNGASSTCTVTPGSGYQLASFTDDSVDKKSSVTGGSYSITSVTSNHTIAATFSIIPPTVANGACGTSNGSTFTVAPVANLCTTGAASTISGSSPWNWSCAGTNGGTTATCTAFTSAVVPVTTKAKIYLGADDSFTLSNSGATLYGGAGVDTITVTAGMSGLILDQNVERINLSGMLVDYTFKQTGNKINVYDAAGTSLIVSAPVQSSGTQLSFSDGMASAKLSAGVMMLGTATVSGTAATKLSTALTVSPQVTSASTNAKAFLGTDDSFTVSNSGTTLYGGAGNDTITIASGMSRVNLDQNVEKITLPGTFANYSFKQTGNKINVYDATVVTLIVSAPVQGDADGTLLSFSDKTVSALLSAGVMTVDGVTVSPATTSATPVTIVDYFPKSGPVGSHVILKLDKTVSTVQGTLTVLYNQKALPGNIISSNADVLQIIVPSDAQSGDIQVNVDTAASNKVNFTILAPVTTSLVSQVLNPSTTEQVISYKDEIVVTVPPGILDSPRKISISTVTNAPSTSFEPFGSSAIDVTIEGLSQLNSPIKVSFRYDPARLNPKYSAKQQLMPLRCDKYGVNCVPLPFSVDEQQKTVTMLTDHLSLFTVPSLAAVGTTIATLATVVIAAEAISIVGELLLNDVYITPEGNFVLKYGKSAIEADTMLNDTTWQTETFSNQPYKLQSYDIGAPAFIQDLGHMLETALQKYVGVDGFKSVKPSWFMSYMSGASTIPITVKVDSYWVQAKGDPNYDSIWQYIHYPTSSLYDYKSTSGLGKSYGVIAHELFHRIQAGYAGLSGSNLWWVEASADYAGYRVAWPNTATGGTYTAEGSPSYDFAGAKYLSYPLSTTGDLNQFGAREYATSIFFQYLVEKKGLNFKDLVEHIAKGDPLVQLNSFPGIGSMAMQYHDFAKNLVFDRDSYLATPSLFSVADYTTTATGKTEESITMVLQPGFTAKLWSIKSDDKLFSPSVQKLKYAITVDKVISSGGYIQPLGNSAVLDVYVLRGDKRIADGDLAPHYTISTDNLSVDVEVEQGDVIYVLGVDLMSSSDVIYGYSLHIPIKLVYKPTPVITSFFPYNSDVIGATVTIVGTGFGSTKGTVTFNGVTAPVAAGDWLDTSIRTMVPAGVPIGTGNVVVTVNGAASNGLPFTVVASTKYDLRFNIQYGTACTESGQGHFTQSFAVPITVADNNGAFSFKKDTIGFQYTDAWDISGTGTFLNTTMTISGKLNVTRGVSGAKETFTFAGTASGYGYIARAGYGFPRTLQQFTTSYKSDGRKLTWVPGTSSTATYCSVQGPVGCSICPASYTDSQCGVRCTTCIEWPDVAVYVPSVCSGGIEDSTFSIYYFL